MASDLIFVLAGQSNMAGVGHFNELPNWLKVKPRNVEFYQYGRLARFSDQPLGRIGPEVAFSKFIAAYYPGRRIAIVKYAVGGTSIYDWAKNWNPRISRRLTDSPIRNSLYDVIRRQIGWSHVLDNQNTVSAFLWMQGERDARFPDAANAYLGNISNLINDFRRDYQSPSAQFILGRINPPSSVNRPAVNIVRRAQENISRQKRNTNFINTDDLQKHPDQIHYNTRGQILLGRRFADEFRRMHGNR